MVRARSIAGWVFALVGAMVLPALVVGIYQGTPTAFLTYLFLGLVSGPQAAVVAPHLVITVPTSLWNGSALCCREQTMYDFIDAMTAAPLLLFAAFVVAQLLARRRASPAICLLGTAIVFSGYAFQLVWASEHFSGLCAGVC